MKPLAWLVLSTAFFAQPNDVAQPDDIDAQLKEFYVREAAAYDFRLVDKPDERFKLERKPLLTWTNVDKYMGSVFIWTRDGRPEVIGCVGSHQMKPEFSHFFHEFHSLGLQPLKPVRVADKEWTPKEAGVTLTAFDDAAAPAATEALRLTQMRNLAREFEGTMKDGQDVTELRLLPQPLFRYKAPKQGIVDGALFTFVWKGSDPEVLLVIEDRKDGEKEQWKYALARFNFRDMWVRHKDKEVWRVKVSTKDDNYVTSMTREISHAEIREANQEKE